jgi:hypothetical protein
MSRDKLTALIRLEDSPDALDQVDGSRRKYLSSDLMDLSALVTDNPWGDGLKEEVNKYIAGKLNRDL